ncbi:MAG: hypothetical protein PHQ35_07635 [Phycisphaerae bacterium]|nr:hypothetical protein [Phycisphaerae bacterium]MDD5380033.1 hypothetical protein [Phycisphaerae bacterium]
MKEEKLEKLLNELADATTGRAPSYLAENIKHQIPQQLSAHKGGIDTVNIIVDLRISKLAAAAAIILTMILFANFFGGRNQENAGIYQNSKLLLQYCFSGIDADRNNVLATAKSRYEYLAQLGKDVVYYGDSVDPRDSDAILMQWKVSDSEYKVLFGNLRERTVSAEELIRLQSRMLQKKGK